METFNVKAFGTEAKDQDLKQMNIDRREVQPNDVEIDIYIAAFATATFILPETTGAARNILPFPDTKL